MRELDAQLAARAAGTIEPIGPVTPEPVASALPSPQVDVAPAAEAAPATPAVASNPVIAVPVAALTVGVPQPAVAPPGGPSILARAAGSLRPAAARVLAISARTLERSPKVARDTAGWIALVTVFFASCMWAIVLFFRSTPVPETYGVPSAVLEPGEATPQGRPRPREEHAGQPHAEESHADDHGAAEDDHGGGGGDGHGGGH